MRSDDLVNAALHSWPWHLIKLDPKLLPALICDPFRSDYLSHPSSESNDFVYCRLCRCDAGMLDL